MEVVIVLPIVTIVKQFKHMQFNALLLMTHRKQLVNKQKHGLLKDLIPPRNLTIYLILATYKKKQRLTRKWVFLAQKTKSLHNQYFMKGFYVVPSRIELESRASETLILSIVLQDQKGHLFDRFAKLWQKNDVQYVN